MARPPTVTQTQLAMICERYAKGESSRQIARAIGIPKSTVNYWTSKIKAQNGIRFNVPECPYCRNLSTLELTPEFEVVCKRCGSIARQSKQLARDISYEVETHAPPNHLDFNKSEGSFLKKRDYYRILKNSEKGTENLGVRYIQVKNFISPDRRLCTVLERGSKRLKQLGLENNYVIGDATGRLLRKIYRNLMLEVENSRFLRSNFISFKRQAIVDSVVAYIVETYLDSRKAEMLIPKLESVDEDIVKLVRDFDSERKRRP